MAKKRTLSKRDVVIEGKSEFLEIWLRNMREAEFKEKLANLIQSFDPSLSGELHISGIVLLYYPYEGEITGNVYLVAILKDDKAIVAEGPFDELEIPF